MNRPFQTICVAILAVTLISLRASADFAPATLDGQTFIHDPSTIIKDGTHYFIFGTGPGIRTKSSPDLERWENGPSVFRRPPRWTGDLVPEFRGTFWAPDVVRVNDRYFLYYAVSSWGKQVSAIGLATNATLDPKSPAYAWHDCGPVMVSSNGYAFNAIDPSVMLDTDGKLWMAFGSYWEGIFLTALNPQTGLLLSTNAPIYHLAWNKSIEAACLTRHGDYYYLFVNWGQCCKGTNSTYEVRVGRAAKVTGPYLDRDGKDLAIGGGSPFLETTGPFIGPGHIGIVSDENSHGPTHFSYHYYDGDSEGRSRLAVACIDWSSGWPVATNAIGNRWKMVWSDEFNQNGRPDPANWNYERGFVRNHEAQWYQPENAVCTNGLLVIEARREHKPNPNYSTNNLDWRASRQWIEYTSASLTSRRLREFKYGRFEMRARIDTRPGSWPAFWTLGDTPGIHWPACGEVDIMEYYRGTVLANFGYGLDRKTKWLASKKPIEALGGEEWSHRFHIWTMEWDEHTMDLLLDGELMNHLDVDSTDNADQGNPFRRPVYIILNQAIGGDSGGDPSKTDFPVRYEIDWVRVYQRAD